MDNCIVKEYVEIEEEKVFEIRNYSSKSTYTSSGSITMLGEL